MSKENLPGLYVHIPFCRSKCPYCDFYSETESSMILAWQSALEQEMLFYRNRFSTFDTLYIGGGTPTVLEGHVLLYLFDQLYRYFHFTADAEITIEANPNDLTGVKLHILKACGVNRISLGVQSFDEQDLLFLKRQHTVCEAEKALDLIRTYGFSNVSIDLMYGIPGQTIEGWLKTLERAVTFHPGHISCYQLTVVEETKLWEMLKSAMIKMPDESEEKAFFLTTAQRLEDHGYLHYEITSFASGEKNRSRHNQKYWQHIPYLGIGPSAHSFQHGKRWWNHRSVAKYCHAFTEGKTPVSGAETLTREQLDLESLYLGLRTNSGVELTHLTANRYFDALLPELLKAEYVKIIGQKMVPTTKGFLVADQLPLALM